MVECFANILLFAGKDTELSVFIDEEIYTTTDGMNHYHITPLAALYRTYLLDNLIFRNEKPTYLAKTKPVL